MVDGDKVGFPSGLPFRRIEVRFFLYKLFRGG